MIPNIVPKGAQLVIEHSNELSQRRNKIRVERLLRGNPQSTYAKFSGFLTPPPPPTPLRNF